MDFICTIWTSFAVHAEDIIVPSIILIIVCLNVFACVLANGLNFVVEFTFGIIGLAHSSSHVFGGSWSMRSRRFDNWLCIEPSSIYRFLRTISSKEGILQELILLHLSLTFQIIRFGLSQLFNFHAHLFNQGVIMSLLRFRLTLCITIAL